jgi:mono/diheme cytochrome c family protein
LATSIILLIVIGLTVLFGWLTYRAVLAKKLVGEDPGRIRGGWQPLTAAPAQRRLVLSEADGFDFIGDMVTGNLTPGGKLAGYSDGELFRVLRYSINQQGHTPGVMSFMPYRELSNEDTETIIAYLRSLPPAMTTGPTGDRFNFLGSIMLGAGLFGEPPPPAPANITAPPQGVTAEYGKYVATFGECRACHGTNLAGSPATSISPAVPNPRPFVSTLTLEQFTAMMRSGVKPDGRHFPETIPWENASNMNDDDLAALYVYLTTQP